MSNGCDDPYFSFTKIKSFIKLKKTTPDLGDTAVVIIEGRRNAVDAQKPGIGKL